MLRLCFVRFSAEQGQPRSMLIVNYYLLYHRVNHKVKPRKNQGNPLCMLIVNY